MIRHIIYQIWEVHKGGLHEDESRWTKSKSWLEIHKIPDDKTKERIEQNYSGNYEIQDYNYQFDFKPIYEGWHEENVTKEDIFKAALLDQLDGA